TVLFMSRLRHPPVELSRNNEDSRPEDLRVLENPLLKVLSLLESRLREGDRDAGNGLVAVDGEDELVSHRQTVSAREHTGNASRAGEGRRVTAIQSACRHSLREVPA